MTSYLPTTIQLSKRTPASAWGLRRTLDRLSYLALCIFVFVIPWGENMRMPGGMPLGSLAGLAAFSIGALRTAVVKKIRKPSLLHYLMLAVAAWSAVSIFWTVDWDATVIRVGTYAQLLVAVWMIWELVTSETRVLGFLQAYVVGALIASLDTIYNYMQGHSASQLAAAEGEVSWETYRYAIAGVNENDLGLMLALSVPMIFYLLVSRRSPLVKLICWIQLVAGVTAILLTASRGSLLATLVGATMFPLIMFRLPRYQRLFSITAFAGVLACGAYFVPQSSWSRILELGSEFSEGTLTHRTQIWAAGLEGFREHPFLGTGSGAYATMVAKAIDRPLVAHNTFLSTLVELGVIGALLLLALLASILYCSLRLKYLERCLWLTLLLTWAVGASGLTWEYRKPTWILFGLAAAHIYSRRKDVWRPLRSQVNDQQTSRIGVLSNELYRY